MMKQAAQRAIEILESLGVSYGDARAETATMEKMVFRNGRLDQGIVRDTAGLGVRAVVGGAWGFGASTGFGLESVDAAARRAFEIAVAASGPAVKRLAPLAPQRGLYRGPLEKDPFSVSPGEKMALLEQVSRETMKDQRIEGVLRLVVVREQEAGFRLNRGLPRRNRPHLQRTVPDGHRGRGRRRPEPLPSGRRQDSRLGVDREVRHEGLGREGQGRGA